MARPWPWPTPGGLSITTRAQSCGLPGFPAPRREKDLLYSYYSREECSLSLTESKCLLLSWMEAAPHPANIDTNTKGKHIL